MSDMARRRWRRRLLLAGLVPLLLVLLLVGKVAAMTLHDRAGRESYRSGDFASARDAFASNSTLNYLQAWVSPFDEGTARYRLADFAGAIRSLEEALDLVPADRECHVRINLALSHEAVGDAASVGGDVAAAGGPWGEGVDVLAQGGCLDSSATEAVAADARAVDERLRTKLEQLEQVPAADPPPEEPETRKQAQAEELQDRADRAERRRRQAEQRRQDREDEQETNAEPPTYEW